MLDACAPRTTAGASWGRWTRASRCAASRRSGRATRPASAGSSWTVMIAHNKPHAGGMHSVKHMWHLSCSSNDRPLKILGAVCSSAAMLACRHGLRRDALAAGAPRRQQDHPRAGATALLVCAPSSLHEALAVQVILVCLRVAAPACCSTAVQAYSARVPSWGSLRACLIWRRR